jgi:S1-C subfamily serine protease
MNRRWLWIIVGVIAFFAVLLVGAVGGAGITYLILQTHPARAAVETGVDTQTDASSEAGVLVAAIVPGSPAEKAGLKRGDIILEIDGEAVNSPRNLLEAIQAKEPGDTIEATVQRGSERLAYSVELGEQDGEVFLGVRPCGDVFGGRGPLSGRLDPFTIPPFGPNLPALPEGVQRAVIVGRVTPDSPADKAGLKAGDVITQVDGEPVKGPADLAEQVQAREPGDGITLTVYRAGEEEPLEIKAVLGEHPDEAGKAYLGVTISGFIRIDQESPNIPEASNFDFRLLHQTDILQMTGPGQDA